MQPLALPRPLPADYDHCSFCSGTLPASRIITRDKYGNPKRFCGMDCHDIWANNGTTGFVRSAPR
jgi:hypothetical protein